MGLCWTSFMNGTFICRWKCLVLPFLMLHFTDNIFCQSYILVAYYHATIRTGVLCSPYPLFSLPTLLPTHCMPFPFFALPTGLRTHCSHCNANPWAIMKNISSHCNANPWAIVKNISALNRGFRHNGANGVCTPFFTTGLVNMHVIFVFRHGKHLMY